MLPMVKWRIANRRDKPAFLFFFFLNVRNTYIYRDRIVIVSIDARVFYWNPKIADDYYFYWKNFRPFFERKKYRNGDASQLIDELLRM